MNLKVNEQIVPIILKSWTLDENHIVISQKNLLFVLNCLKLHIGYQYKLLSCITGVDFLGLSYRFGVFYDLLSITHNCRLRLKVYVNEVTSIDSITNIFKNSDWWEREIWDLYGIYFNNHEDLRRILTDYGFEGYPMRKDFPLTGYIELKYDLNKKRISIEPVYLSQEFRTFTYEMPWQNESNN